MNVFVLWHVREEGDDDRDTKLIGIYESESNAKAVIQRYRTLPGFRDFPESFLIDKYELDKDHWESGFADLTKCSSISPHAEG